MKGRPIHLIAHAAHPSMVLHRATRLGSTCRPGRVIDWLKIKESEGAGGEARSASLQTSLSCRNSAKAEQRREQLSRVGGMSARRTATNGVNPASTIIR